jgi:hypothetical protein
MECFVHGRRSAPSFKAWTKSEAFRVAHHMACDNWRPYGSTTREVRKQSQYRATASEIKNNLCTLSPEPDATQRLDFGGRSGAG